MNRIIQLLSILVLTPLANISPLTMKPLCCLDSFMYKVAEPPIYSFSTTPELARAETKDRYVFSAHHFTEIVTLHNDLLPRLVEFREVMATHAVQLAQLVKTLQGAESLNESSIRDHIHNWEHNIDSLSGASVFQPWANRWTGRWGNGSPQFHIWDETRRWGEQWIQAVAQSEYAFPEEAELSDLLQNNKTDIGINVFSEEYGVTGWVSKRQHGQFEIPCIGYVLDKPILLWFCAMDYEDTLDSGQWFVYLEYIEKTVSTHQYVIAGHPFTIQDGIVWSKNMSSVHAGRYTAE